MRAVPLRWLAIPRVFRNHTSSGTVRPDTFVAMKNIITIAALFATAFLANAEDKSVADKVRDKAEAAVEKTKEIAQDTKDAIKRTARKTDRAVRAVWCKTKECASDEMPVYRGAAMSTITELGREIVALRSQTPLNAPLYFRTRLQSLDEQLELLSNRLSILSLEQFQTRTTGPRIDFDRCVADLEEAIDQAENGTAVLNGSILALK